MFEMTNRSRFRVLQMAIFGEWLHCTVVSHGRLMNEGQQDKGPSYHVAV